MEKLIEELCAALDTGSPLDDLLVQIKHLRASTKDTVISLALAKETFGRLLEISPCLEDVLLVVLPMILGPNVTIETMNIPATTPKDVVGWIRLGLFCIAANRSEGPSPVPIELLDPQSLYIPASKQAVFKARFIEALTKNAHKLILDGPLEDWMIECLFSSDDLVLQKTKELIVAALLQSRSESLFRKVFALHRGMKIKYQLLALLFSARESAWDIPEEFLMEAKQTASRERGLAPAICDCLVALMGCSGMSADGRALFSQLMRLDDAYRPQLAKYLLPRAIATQPQLVKAFAGNYVPVPGNMYSLETYILLLHTVCAEFGGLPEDGAVDTGILRSALDSANDEIRLGAFGCICRAFGPGRAVSGEYLALLRSFLRHLALDSGANLRQKALVSLQALLLSLFARLYTLYRTSALEEAQSIKAWLSDMLSDQLDSLDASHRHQFGCVDLGLRVLREFAKAIAARRKSKAFRTSTPSDSLLEAAIEEIVAEVITSRRHLLFETILDNSFDSSRQMAAQVATDFGVLACEAELLGLQEEALRRLRSPKEALSDGAALMLILVSSSKQQDYVDRLRAQLEHAQKDIAQAAARDNLNGTLCLLGHLSARGRLQPDAELLQLAIRVGRVVAEFAAQPSPEGSDLGQFLDSTGLVPATQTCQLILTFCWRAIKESTYAPQPPLICLIQLGTCWDCWCLR